MALFWPLIGVLVVVLYLLQRPPASSLRHIPTVKYNAYLPNFINRLIYYPKAASMISEGYQKVRSILEISRPALLTCSIFSTRIVHFACSPAMEKSLSCQ
jgi:hypothetical protein